jgi:putative ABC transport system permease protein
VILVALASAPLLWLLVRRPVLRRLALRNASRRPRETALVVVGSMLGTAIITSAFVVGDTLDASLRHGAVTRLGPIDEVVRTAGAAEQEELARRLAAVEGSSPSIDGVLPVTAVAAAVSTFAGGGEVDRVEPAATVLELDFDAGRDFGDDPGATGIEGATPPPGRAALSQDLAGTLGVAAGEQVTVYAYGRRLDLHVERVLARRGIAGFSLPEEGAAPAPGGGASPTLLVAPGTVSGLATAEVAAGAAPTTLVAVSNRGDVFEGATTTEAAVEEIAAVLDGAPPGLSTVKADLLAQADEVGAQFTELFGSIGFFSVLAGVLLLVNIFVMLAQERKSELGMLRAVGLRRSAVVGSFTLEGWAYALAAAVLGAVVGIGVGRVVAGVATGIFGGGEGVLELHFAVERGSVETGFALGFAISLATVLLTSLFISRLNVIRAIRDLPEPSTTRPRLRSLVAGALAVAAGGAWSASGVPADEPFATLAGPVVILAGAAALLVRVAPRRVVISLASAGALAWAVSAFGLLPDAFDGADIAVFVVQGVVLTAAAVALVSYNQEAVATALRRLGGGRSMSLRLGLAYPLARRFRTGMILAMYSLVVFTLVFIIVLSDLFAGQIDQFTADVSGGFDLRVSSSPSNPVTPEQLRARGDVEQVAALADVGAQFATSRTGGELRDWYVTGIDDAFVEQGPSALDDLGEFPDAESAYRAVLSDPGAIIVSDFFLQGGGGPPEAALTPGEQVTLRDPVSGRTAELTVVAVAKSSFANDGAFVSLDALRDLYGPRVTANRLLVAVAPGADPSVVAGELEATYLANGVRAESFRELVSTNLAFQTQFFRLMQGYLALGLVVGVAGLGVVMVRAVRERRRQVGVLRALGYEAGAVRRAFTVESAFVTLEGVAVGTTLALVTAWRIVANDTFGELGFNVPWLEVGGLVLATFVASILATAAPARQAARIRPAVALRLAD